MPPISAMRHASPRSSPKRPRAASARTPAATVMRTSVAVAGPKSRSAITSSGNESTKTLIANASSANAERGGGSVTEERRAAGRARTRPRCARRLRAAWPRRPAPRPPCRGRCASEPTLTGAPARAIDWHRSCTSSGYDAHVGAVDLEGGVARGGPLGQPIEARGEIGRRLRPADRQPHGMRDDVVAAVVDGVAEPLEVVVPGLGGVQRHGRVEDRVIAAQAVHRAEHQSQLVGVRSDEGLLHLAHARIVGPVLELQPDRHRHARHGPAAAAAISLR